MITIDTTIYVKPPNRISVYLDWLQMLTGIGLIIFMWSHMILVASVNLGTIVMNSIAWFLETTYIAQIGGPFIWLIMIIHFILTSRKIPFTSNEQSSIWRHAKMLHHTDTWLWLVQVITAMIILIMGSIHIWTILTNLPITAQKSAIRVQHGFWTLFYLILLPTIELHAGIGFYRIMIKWGFVKNNKRNKFKQSENILTTIMIVIGLITIIRFTTLIII